MGDSGAFWGTIVQVVPVMFIAAMIEFRYLFARFAKSEAMFLAARWKRVVLGVMMLVVAGLLLSAFMTALEALRMGTPTDAPESTVALLALSAAAGVSLGSPGAVLFLYATADIWTPLVRRLPWSAASKRRRHNQARREEKRKLLQRARELRYLLLLDTSRFFVRAGQLQRAAKSMSVEERLVRLQIVGEMYALADESLAALRSFDQTIAEAEALEEADAEADAGIAKFRELLAEQASRISG